MYIYPALINALSAHMIHINLKYDILYTCKTIYIKYYTKKQKRTTNTHTRTHTCTPPYTHTHTLTVAETGYWY